jgi:N-glycosylase/DNA lyase
MNISVINTTIKALCAEVSQNSQDVPNWRLRTEEELLQEICICMFSSQMLFEVAEASARHVKNLGLLCHTDIVNHEKRVLEALSTPLFVDVNNKVRLVRPRFKNRLANMLATTMSTIRMSGQPLRDTLFAMKSAHEARERLIKLVWGFGPKQASLFLRRIGYCANLAVLDTHVLDYLRLAQGITPKPSSLSRLCNYEKIEAAFQAIADEFGYTTGCVDLATWITMRVAKRETIL